MACHPGAVAPQKGQIAAGGAAHSPQNFMPGGFSCWHRGHCIPTPLSEPGRERSDRWHDRPARAAGVGKAHRLLDHLIRPLEERQRDRQAERFGSLEVDDEFELRRRDDPQIGRLAVESLAGAPTVFSADLLNLRLNGSFSGSSRTQRKAAR
jgi:hypothetical protein